MALDDLAIAPPYEPSWFDRLKARLERSDPPAWVTYLVLALIPIPLILIADVLTGAYPLTSVLPFHVFLAVLPGATLWFMHFLDNTAARALDQTAPVLNVGPGGEANLRYLLTRMPAAPALAITILGGVIVLPILMAISILDPQDQFFGTLGITRAPLSLGSFLLLIGAGYAVGFLFLFHTFRQLRLIRQIYERHVRVDLLDLGPVYTFSRVTALTALAIQVQADLWIVTNPAAGSSFVPVASVIGLTILCAFIFIVPLWGIHRRISDEKTRVVRDNARSRERLMDELRAGIESADLGRATAIKDAIVALDVEAKSLLSIRTWPWEPETLRLLLTAVLLPTALFIVQYLVRLLLPTI